MNDARNTKDLSPPSTLRLPSAAQELGRVALIGSAASVRAGVHHYLTALGLDVVTLEPDARPRTMARMLGTATHVVYVAVEPPLRPMLGDHLQREFGVFAQTLDSVAAHAPQARFIYASPLSLRPNGLRERLLHRLREPWMAYRRACESELALSGLPFLVLRVPPLADQPSASTRYVLADVVRARESARGRLPRAALAVLIGEALRGGYPAGLRIALYADAQGLPLAEAVAQLRRWPDHRASVLRPTQPLAGTAASAQAVRRAA